MLLSSYGVGQAPPENPLRRIELAVASSGVPYTILRPVAFMENFSEGLRWRESFARSSSFAESAVGAVAAWRRYPASQLLDDRPDQGGCRSRDVAMKYGGRAEWIV